MRIFQTLPLAAAILLAACGGDADTDGDGELSAEEVAAEAQGATQMRPGQYRATGELVEFTVAGAPEEAIAPMRAAMASGLAEGNTFCLTQQEIDANGPEQMVKNLAETDCTMSRFDVSGGSLVAEMQCPGGGGLAGTVKVEGQMTGESSDMTMAFESDLGGGRKAQIKMRNTAQRIGDCPA